MSLQACLDQAAAAMGLAESDDWEPAEGPDSGLGVDHWFSMTVKVCVHDDTTFARLANGTYALNINQDQAHYTWEITCAEDEEFHRSGAVNDEEEVRDL